MESRYDSWLEAARSLPGTYSFSTWRIRAHRLEAQFEQSARPVATYKRYQTRMKNRSALQFNTVKYLGFALLDYFTKDSRGPLLSLEAAAGRLGIALDEIRPNAVVAYLRDRVESVPTDPRSPVVDCTAEYVRSVLSVRTSPTGFVWFTSITKRLRFHRAFRRDLTSSVWPNERWDRPIDVVPGDWGLSFEAGSREFVLTPAPVVLRPDHLELRIRISPRPQSGDYLQYTRWFITPHLNPLRRDQLPPNTAPGVIVGGTRCDVYDGVQITEPTEELQYSCEFPAECAPEENDVVAFVAKRSGLLDALVPEERPRLDVRIASFAGTLTAALAVRKPLTDLFYGFGWRLPPSRR